MPTSSDSSFAPPAGPSAEAVTLSERLASELAERWRRGERPRAEEFLDRHPELWNDPEAASDLIYEEVCLRQELGDAGAAADVLRRFPQWREQLEILLRFHQMLEPEPAGPAFPGPGETLGEFVLLAELGRGARGRVFLANQPSLANRLVVLKLTPRNGHEHVSLSRLQHTNIVPVHSVQDDPARNLRILCMPYFGGQTLAHLLEACAAAPRCAGQQLLDALDRGQPAHLVALPPRGAMRHYLERASYVQAVCALGACLADALQYAHERGLIHLDVKPSNVLVAADGQPMLLDFHLARPPIQPDGSLEEWVGGTLLYMSPEQHAALQAVQAGQKVPVAVDGRSDLYSLGLLLYQALGGAFPLPADGLPPRLDRCNPQVSPGLADVIHKCLAPDPKGRYAEASAVAADLRRHLADLPLRGVTNRSLAERWRKWRRRRPHAPRLLYMGLAVGLAALAVSYFIYGDFNARHAEIRALLHHGVKHRVEGRHVEAVQTLHRGLILARGPAEQGPDAAAPGPLEVVQQGLTKPFLTPLIQEVADEYHRAKAEGAQAARGEGIKHLDGKRYHDARQSFQNALAFAQDLPDQDELRKDLTEQVALTERLQQAEQLHAFVDRIRYLYGTSLTDLAGLENAEKEARAWWEKRRLFADERSPQLAEDLLDLAVLWTDLRGRLGAEDPAAVAREALSVLDEVDARFGPSGVLARERQRHAEALGLKVLAGEAARRSVELPPRTAWEHYALGRSYLQASQLGPAAAALQQAVRLQPDGFWPNFYEGVCAYRQDRPGDAAVAFTACIAREPTSAPCYYNRALAFTKLKQAERAVADYDRALQLNPRLGAAALNRGILHFQEKRTEQALTDFAYALKHGANPAQVHYHVALVHRAQDRPEEAQRSLERALRHDRNHAGALTLLNQLKQTRP